jgi:Leucine-rich repeat (LRR) protein
MVLLLAVASVRRKELIPQPFAFEQSRDTVKVGDGGLIQIKAYKSLTELNLYATQVGNAGLAHLTGLEKLTSLVLVKTKVTAKGVEGLAKALPKCKIEWDGGVIEPMAGLDSDRRAAEYVLSIGGTVRINGAEREIGAVAELPQGPFRLTSVNLRGNKQVTDASLAAFQDCTNVTYLNLSGTQVTDEGLMHFKDCKGLTELRLEGVRVTDAGLAAFKNCNLKTFNLGNTPVTDAGLAHLKDCKDLTVCHLLNTPVTDTGLAHLKDCKNLTWLDLRGTKVTDTGLAYFKDCKNLSTLWLVNTPITDAGLALFESCKKLTQLELSGTSITDAGLAHFTDCKNLIVLYLDGTKVSDAGLAHFKGTPLTHLWINNTGITDLTPLQGMSLEDIRLTPKNITKGLDILKGMKSLKTIGITWDQAWPAAEFWERYDKGEFKE